MGATPEHRCCFIRRTPRMKISVYRLAIRRLSATRLLPRRRCPFPLNVPPVVTGSASGYFGDFYRLIQEGANQPIVVRTHPTGPLPPFPGQGQVPTFYAPTPLMR